MARFTASWVLMLRSCQGIMLTMNMPEFGVELPKAGTRETTR